MKRTLAAAAALVLLASSSGAEPAFQCPLPGTVITYSNGSSLTFTEQAGATCRARTKEGNLVPLFLGLILPGPDLEKNQGERLLPLRVGNEIEFMSSGTTANATGDLVNTVQDIFYDDSVKVAAQEKLVTAAGTFDTFVVEFHRQARGAKWRGAWLATAWLAPELGSTVKYKLETRQGYGSDTQYEIASFTLPRQGPAVASATAGGATAETIKLQQVGSLYVVPAQVNGTTTLNFVLDTGASDVAITADVVQMLTRAGSVSSWDFVGTKTYVMADGSKLPSETFTLHELSVGGHTVKNVIAHVVPVQGHLLLGQSFLSRLPTWTIDYKQPALVIGGSAGGPSATPTTAQSSAVPRTAAPSAPVAPPPAQAQSAGAGARTAAGGIAGASAPAPAFNADAADLAFWNSIKDEAQPALFEEYLKQFPNGRFVALAKYRMAKLAKPSVSAAAQVTVGLPAAASASVRGGSDDTAFHCPRTGTTIEYNTGAKLSFLEEEGFRCAYNDGAVQRRAKFAVFADDARFIDAGLGKLWPLQVGAEQTFRVGAASERFKVLGRETVTVTAGTFDTFLIEQEEAAPDQRAVRRYWVSTNLGIVVKSDFAARVDHSPHWGSGTERTDIFLLPGDYEAVRINNPGG